MEIKVNNKFNRGDIVYGAFEPGDVNFEDRLPVVKLKVIGIYFSGELNRFDELTMKISYEVQEFGSAFANHRMLESELFTSEKDAKEKAKELTIKAVDRLGEKFQKAKNILNSEPDK